MEYLIFLWVVLVYYKLDCIYDVLTNKDKEDEA